MPKWLEFTIQLLPVGALIAAAIGAGVVFFVRLESDTEHLQDEVSELQVSVDEVQTGVDQVKINQQRILDALANIKVAMGNHVHEADGTVSAPLPSN